MNRSQLHRTSLLSRSRRARRQAGFTLIEILLVVSILVVLMAILVPNLAGARETANKRTASVQVRKFENEFEKYSIIFGSYPAADQGFQALINPPDQTDNTSSWSSPIKSLEEIKDPWQTPLNYKYPGEKNSAKPDIWSNGPDKAPARPTILAIGNRIRNKRCRR